MKRIKLTKREKELSDVIKTAENEIKEWTKFRDMALTRLTNLVDYGSEVLPKKKC